MTSTDSHALALGMVVDALKHVPSVIAIASYGSTATDAWNEHSDIDLVAVLDSAPSVESIRFFVRGVPVDLNLRCADDSARGIGGASFVPDMRAVWDPDGVLGAAKSTSRASLDLRSHRYLLRHSVDKIRQLADSERATRIAIAADCGLFLRAYFVARDETFPGTRDALRRLHTEAPELLEVLERALLNPRDAAVLLEQAAQLAMSPVGGPWVRGEVLVVGWDGRTSSEDTAQIAKAFHAVVEASDPPRIFR